ncbi:MAG: hypothetical protein IIB90_18805, partial [Gemmatimonadetes bacterium]|nr:hypothetical protein [Gemmatimonadota bacterium]
LDSDYFERKYGLFAEGDEESGGGSDQANAKAEADAKQRERAHAD